jgi:hypothetical protein
MSKSASKTLASSKNSESLETQNSEHHFAGNKNCFEGVKLNYGYVFGDTSS